MFHIAGAGYDPPPTNSFYLFTWLYLVLVAACGIFLQHARSSSPNRNRTLAPCTGDVES